MSIRLCTTIAAVLLLAGCARRPARFWTAEDAPLLAHYANLSTGPALILVKIGNLAGETAHVVLETNEWWGVLDEVYGWKLGPGLFAETMVANRHAVFVLPESTFASLSKKHGAPTNEEYRRASRLGLEYVRKTYAPPRVPEEALFPFLFETLYPALFDNLDGAFPEFGWVKRGPIWKATNGETTRARFEVAPQCVECTRPEGFSVQGGVFTKWIDYVDGKREPFEERVRRLAKRTGVPMPPAEEAFWYTFDDPRMTRDEGYALMRLFIEAGALPYRSCIGGTWEVPLGPRGR